MKFDQIIESKFLILDSYYKIADLFLVIKQEDPFFRAKLATVMPRIQFFNKPINF
jgi:hypothetical protein